MKAGQKLDTEQRRQRVADFFAETPRASHRDAARALGIPKTTVERDLNAIVAAIRARAADVLVAQMVNRAEAIAAAAMPLVLRRGSVPHGQLVLAADKQTAALLGLNAPTRSESTVEVNVRQVAEDVAAEFGRPVDEVIAAAEEIIRAGR